MSYRDLRYLFFANNEIRDLSPLTELVNVVTIDFSDNHISECLFLLLFASSTIIALVVFLFCCSPTVPDLSALQHLQVVDLSGNELTTLRPLMCPNLTKLSVCRMFLSHLFCCAVLDAFLTD